MFQVKFFEDPAEVLDLAGGFLAARPVECNLVLRLLHERVVDPEPGHYWIVRNGSEMVGVVFQSPVDFLATLTPMASTAGLVAQAIAEAGYSLPGVSAEAATAAAFAGQWTEATACGAHPTFGQRLYALDDPQPVADVAGSLRQARENEVELLTEWFDAFRDEAAPAGPRRDHRKLVAKRVRAGRLWVWEADGRPVTFSGLSRSAAGVACLGPVFTPPDLRRQGYAGACVGALSLLVTGQGERAILFTDLANPTSNGIYRRLGYRAVMEIMVYNFQPRVAAEAADRL